MVPCDRRHASRSMATIAIVWRKRGLPELMLTTTSVGKYSHKTAPCPAHIPHQGFKLSVGFCLGNGGRIS